MPVPSPLLYASQADKGTMVPGVWLSSSLGPTAVESLAQVSGTKQAQVFSHHVAQRDPRESPCLFIPSCQVV